ncbi:MAG: UMP kinase [Promethearchaeota archaeon]
MGEKIVIKIGGSLLFKDDNTIDVEKITEVCKVLQNRKKFESIVIICGGGIIARDYINVVREFSDNEALCDIMGIEVSRINSKLFISNLGDEAYPQVPKTIEELSKAMLFKKIIIMGGLQPGQSTTSVAIEVAEYIKANKIVILTNVDGIYDKDPKKFKDAKLFKNITYDQLQELILNSSGNNQAAAGEYRIFDTVSLQILKRCNIPLFLMNGKDLTGFKKVYEGQQHTIGTQISN